MQGEVAYVRVKEDSGDSRSGGARGERERSRSYSPGNKNRGSRGSPSYSPVRRSPRGGGGGGGGGAYSRSRSRSPRSRLLKFNTRKRMKSRNSGRRSPIRNCSRNDRSATKPASFFCLTLLRHNLLLSRPTVSAVTTP